MYLLSGVLLRGVVFLPLVLWFCLFLLLSRNLCKQMTCSDRVHIQEHNLSNREREKRERENILFKKITFHFSSEICQIITNTGICTIFHSVPLMVPGAKCLLIRYFKTCFKISTALVDYFYKPELHVSRGSQNIHIKFGGGGGDWTIT